MEVNKENLVDLEEKFCKVKKLIESSISDPESAPYTSKYAARQHLESMNELLDQINSKNRTNNHMCKKIIGMLAAVQLQLGNIALETEELDQSEKHYQECINLIEGNEYENEVASVTINLYNQLGILWSSRAYEKGIVYMTQAEEFYKELKENGIVPIDYMDYFKTNYVMNEEEALKKLEKAYTHTLFYLAQAYTSSNTLKSAIYCHQTVQRQYDSHEYDYIDWALNTATLSQFFTEKNGFKQARHHLCASLFMMDKVKCDLDENFEEGEAFEAKVEIYRHRYADIARCWVKYGINLLGSSKDRLLNTINIEETLSTCTDLAKRTDLKDFDVTIEQVNSLQFKNIDISNYEEQITDQFILTIEDAKKVFNFSAKWVVVALEYHTLDTHASDHVEITQDHSQLYDLLSFFIDDPEEQCRIYKRSSVLLETVQAAINPQYYMSYSRQNWYRIGVLASDMLEIKLEKLKNNPANAATGTSKQKVTSLADKAINNFNKFIDSFRSASGTLPDRIPESDEKCFLQVHFLIGAIQTRYCTSDKAVQIGKIEKGIQAYQALIDYCKVHDKAGDLVKAELEIAETMVPLLKLKIVRINTVTSPANK